MLYRLIRRKADAIQHHQRCLGQFNDARCIEDGWDTLQLACRCLTTCQMIHSQHGVSLAATESRLQLNYRIATATNQPLHD